LGKKFEKNGATPFVRLTLVRPDICAIRVPFSGGLQNGVCHFCSFKIDQVMNENAQLKGF
jgi:hypothetical protein